MTIAFSGHCDAFDFHKIGGTDALVRRIALHLAQREKVYVVTYGHDQASREDLAPRVTHIRCTSFGDLLDTVAQEKISDVVTIYFHAKDRLRLITRGRHARFHTVLTTYNSALWKRWALLWSSRLCFNGVKFCISQRIAQAMGRLSHRAVLLWPPVEDDFFCTPTGSKGGGGKIRVAFMGRLDWGKGADIALDMFECLAQDAPDCEFYAYAYPWKNDPTSQALHYRLQSHPTVTYIEAKLVDDLDTMDANLRASIDAVDVFFLPYRALLSTIDSPLVPMEVAARCKPFVTTDIEGLPSLPVKGGVFLPPDHAQDPARVAEALYGLIQAPDSSPDLSYSVSAVADVMCQAIADAAPKTGPARSAKRI